MSGRWWRRAAVVAGVLFGVPVALTRLTGCLFPDYVADLEGYNCTPGDTSVHCATSAPQGWLGPVAIGDDGGCPALLVPAAGATQYYEYPTGAPAACKPCTCSPDGVQCVFDEVELRGDGCNSSCGATVDLATSDCWTFQNAEACTSARARAVVVPNTAGCAPAGGERDILPAFDRRVVLCLPRSDVGTGCTDGAMCVPTEANCYYKQGPATCAAGEQPHTLYETHQDTRDCAACTCNTNCVGRVHKNQNQNGCGPLDCDDETQTYFNVEEPCFELGQVSQLHAFKYCGGAQCEPDGGQPIGDAGFSDEITVCCPTFQP